MCVPQEASLLRVEAVSCWRRWEQLSPSPQAFPCWPNRGGLPSCLSRPGGFQLQSKGSWLRSAQFRNLNPRSRIEQVARPPMREAQSSTPSLCCPQPLWAECVSDLPQTLQTPLSGAYRLSERQVPQNLISHRNFSLFPANMATSHLSPLSPLSSYLLLTKGEKKVIQNKIYTPKSLRIWGSKEHVGALRRPLPAPW